MIDWIDLLRRNLELRADLSNGKSANVDADRRGLAVVLERRALNLDHSAASANTCRSSLGSGPLPDVPWLFSQNQQTARGTTNDPAPVAPGLIAIINLGRASPSYMRMTAPAMERARERTRPPSLPDCTIHLPLEARPTICPT